MDTQTHATVSALTVARGRTRHLHNVMLSLARQTVLPDELIIGVMQDALFEDLPQVPFPVRQVRVEGDELPLSRARNAVARAARGEVLVFLDVDCIPDAMLVADYRRHAADGAGLIMGEVMYLPKGRAAEGWTYDAFEAVAVRHSDRQGPPAEGVAPCNDYRCFWSLNFAMSAADWARAGGFDERFTGYGGEDTDFGRILSEKGIPISWAKGARAYHQFHEHYMPPVHHIPSILRNSELFATKWGHRTMEHWLHAFRLMGLIAPCRTGLQILRTPSEEELAMCRQQDHMPYAATGRVIRILEDRERARKGLPPVDQTPAERHRLMTKAQEELLAPAGGHATAAE